ncbi:MAG: hypothetical protein JW841_10140 [Deltaproteobacteria bacterium]|nr:hypothetical protein [Deltaproteobacteria bacterium]
MIRKSQRENDETKWESSVTSPGDENSAEKSVQNLTFNEKGLSLKESDSGVSMSIKASGYRLPCPPLSRKYIYPFQRQKFMMRQYLRQIRMPGLLHTNTMLGMQ